MLVQKEDPTTQSERGCSLILPRFILIDYNNAGIPHVPPRELDSRPCNAAEHFWYHYLWEDIAGWVPNIWRDDQFQKGWLLRRFRGDGQREMYRPLPQWIDRYIQRKGSGRQREDQPSLSTGSGKIRSEISASWFHSSYVGEHKALSSPKVDVGPGCDFWDPWYPEQKPWFRKAIPHSKRSLFD